MTEGLQADSRSRILVLDDDESQLDTLSALLEDEGFDVVVSQTADAGIERLGRGDVDVAVVDLHLPDVEEARLLDSLAELADDVASIIHTGYSSYQSAKKAVNIGAFAYVEKGGDPSELLRQVHRAVQTRLARRAETLEKAVADRTRELQEANEALRGTKGDLMRAQRIARVGSWSWDVRTGTVTWSDETYRLFGYEPGEIELSYEVVKSMKHPDDVDRWANAVAGALDSADTLEIECRAIRPDGKTIWIRTEAEITRKESGEPIEFFGTAQDITDRKEAEIAIQQERYKLREYFENLPALAYNITFDGVVADCSQSTVAALGYDSKDELIGKPLITTVYAPASREKARLLFDKWKEVGKVKDEELQVVTKQGKVIDVLLNVTTIFDQNDDRIHSLSTQTVVTERKRAEEHLRASEKKYRALVNVPDVIVSRVDKNLKHTFVNKAGLDFMDLAEDDVIGKTGREIVGNQPFIDEVEASFAEIFKTKKSKIDVIRMRDRYLQCHYSPELDEVGNISGITSFVIDVTDREEAEQAVLLRDRAVDTAAEGISITDPNQPDHPVIYVNQGFERLTGYNTAEILGRNMRFLQGPDTDPEALGEMRSGIQEGREFSLELLSYRKDGTPFWNRVTITPVRNEKDEITHFIGVHADVTELRESRQRLADQLAELNHLYDTSPVGLCVLDTDLRYVRVNNMLADINGRPASEHIGRTLAEVIPELADQLVPIYERVMETGQPELEFEVHGTTSAAPDTEKDWLVSYYPIRSPEGKSLGVGTVVQDITERKLLEEQLRHTQKMEAVGQLAAGVAHEFNNLLFGILGSTELILATQEGELPEHFERPLRDIKKCGRRGAALTKQLLSFARKRKPEVSQCEINEIVSGLEGVLRQMLTEAIALEVVLGSDLPPIEVDRGEIEQALLNLARNARDAMPDGGALTIRTAVEHLDEARVSSYPHARPHRYVQLSVADTGCGMAPDTKKRIFEPFFTTKPVGQGTGLGLSTVFADVTKHGGVIEVQSQQGEGTVFHIYLPSAKETADTDSDHADRSIDQFPGGTETILVVDDDEVVLDSGVFLLEMRGYNVLRAQGAPQALEAAAAHDGTIDLLLSDVIMPEMNGWELAKKLTAQRPNLKVIFMSGYAQDVLDAGASKGDHIEFIEKPPEGDALFRRIREVLDAPARPETQAE